MARPEGWKNLTLPAETIELIRQLQVELIPTFGFEPTYTQVVKYLVNYYRRQNQGKDPEKT